MISYKHQRYSILFFSILSGCMVYEAPDQRRSQRRPLNIAKYDKQNLRKEARSAECQYSQLTNPDFTKDNLQYACWEQKCTAVPVTVQYLLGKDLGVGQTAVVEAFNNPMFLGPPSSMTILTDFDTSQALHSQTTFLKLKPGEYYIRARLEKDQTSKPYQYKDMVLIQHTPVGFFGAISTPKKLIVNSAKKRLCRQVIYVAIDKLFASPNEDPKTLAKLRMLINLKTEASAPPKHTVYIELHETKDFAKIPRYRYKLPTEQFMISTHIKQTEFISPNLEPGHYYVYAYLDANQNSYSDSPEPQGFFQQGGKKTTLLIQKNRTETIKIDLDISKNKS